MKSELELWLIIEKLIKIAHAHQKLIDDLRRKLK